MSRVPDLDAVDAYWRAANYLSAAQIFLQDNVLLERDIRVDDIKPRLLGHWGTCPGLNLCYAHANRLILQTDARLLYVAGPGHGAPAILANLWLEGSWSELYPALTRDADGMHGLCRQFSTPGGVPSHIGAHVPGSMHEGGELGYSLLHAFGAVFDNPDLIALCVVGDGEAETGPLAAAWKSIAFLNPIRDGAVLPVLHLNGYKISGPTVDARMPDGRLLEQLGGHGYHVIEVAGDDPATVHREFAAALDAAYERIQTIQHRARQGEGWDSPPPWPLIVLRTPKGWTGPAELNGLPVEGSFRSHQVPLPGARDDAAQREQLEAWLRRYRPAELFDAQGRPTAKLEALIPRPERRMGRVPESNGGQLREPLARPDPADYAVAVSAPGRVRAEATRALGQYVRDLFRRNAGSHNFRLFCPDETTSNRLDAVFEATERCFVLPVDADDEAIGPEGRVMEVLSEHCCQGWLEGYLLTGRHGLFPCYEAFTTIVDSMLNQYAKWLKASRETHWRAPVASLNYLLTSHAWRQDHNGYSHQGPGFIDNVINRKSRFSRLYFPPDANCLLHVMHDCFASEDCVNVVVAGKQPELQWLNYVAAGEHCRRGLGRWAVASSDTPEGVDAVLACIGDIPTVEAMAAAALLREHLPELRLRLVNVVDLMTLSPPEWHPQGIDAVAFRELFTDDRPVIVAYHGYTRMIHDLVHGRPKPERFHVRGYMEEGTTTTPFDMVVLNRLSRFHLVLAILDAVPEMPGAAATREFCEAALARHHEYIREHFTDMPEIADWHWPGA